MIVPTPMRPPGTAYCSSFFSVYNDSMREKMGVTCASVPVGEQVSERE
jgi:hypothetical protein